MRKRTDNITFATYRGQKRIYEGYWKDNSRTLIQFEEPLPTPVHSDTPPTHETQEFLKQLTIVEEYISACHGHWNTGMMGWSTCRCCGKKNGTTEFELPVNDGDTLLVWPEGLQHYYKEHGITPSIDFVEKINNAFHSNRDAIEEAIHRHKVAREEDERTKMNLQQNVTPQVTVWCPFTNLRLYGPLSGSIRFVP